MIDLNRLLSPSFTLRELAGAETASSIDWRS